MIGGKWIELKEFGGLGGGGVPFVHEVVVSDADVIEKVPGELIGGGPWEGSADVLVFGGVIEGSDFEAHVCGLRWI